MHCQSVIQTHVQYVSTGCALLVSHPDPCLVCINWVCTASQSSRPMFSMYQLGVHCQSVIQTHVQYVSTGCALLVSHQDPCLVCINCVCTASQSSRPMFSMYQLGVHCQSVIQTHVQYVSTGCALLVSHPDPCLVCINWVCTANQSSRPMFSMYQLGVHCQSVIQTHVQYVSTGYMHCQSVIQTHVQYVSTGCALLVSHPDPCLVCINWVCTASQSSRPIFSMYQLGVHCQSVNQTHVQYVSTGSALLVSHPDPCLVCINWVCTASQSSRPMFSMYQLGMHCQSVIQTHVQYVSTGCALLVSHPDPCLVCISWVCTASQSSRPMFSMYQLGVHFQSVIQTHVQYVSTGYALLVSHPDPCLVCINWVCTASQSSRPMFSMYQLGVHCQSVIQTHVQYVSTGYALLVSHPDPCLVCINWVCIASQSSRPMFSMYQLGMHCQLVIQTHVQYVSTGCALLVSHPDPCLVCINWVCTASQPSRPMFSMYQLGVHCQSVIQTHVQYVSTGYALLVSHPDPCLVCINWVCTASQSSRPMFSMYQLGMHCQSVIQTHVQYVSTGYALLVSHQDPCLVCINWVCTASQSSRPMFSMYQLAMHCQSVMQTHVQYVYILIRSTN